MKSVTLLRHAKSSWDDPVDRDFDRPLNDKGRRAAVTMGTHMHEKGLAWDQVISSPAIRVIETLDGVEEGYGSRLRPEFDKRIYMAAAVTLLDIIHDADPDAGRIMLAGHNPGLEDLIFLLTPSDGSEYRRIVDVKYPTATLSEMHFDVDAWSSIERGGGKLVSLVRPRDLDPELGPDG
ncbi:histidine phosphatase family protein [Pacificimonas sp. WHA3]|uniref:Histidine phosphatase family protein n=1 Tax=Pacificimonas pallii TaxID=2827236 RepID=A0ABS6SBG8_9SPHN|nr:histidine phosphatase family protein [Pacificimonas pallii]MBV7255666.1 histidine phosphatase family protein [Pacificimonas pallii]